MSADHRKLRSVAVFLAANIGNDPGYKELAQHVAAMFANNRWKLVYGGSARGLMGILGQTASTLGVDVHGVKPRPFLKYEETGQLPEFGHHELVDDLHSQKRRIAELSDAFIILPGGFGTLEEYTAIRMWSKLGICRRPIVLLNFQNFYTPLLDWITGATKSGFISENSAAVVSVVNSIEEMSLSLLKPNPLIDNDDKFDWSVVAPEHTRSLLESQLEKSLLETADQVSLQLCLTVHWSTWHTWNYYNRIEPGITEANDHIWKSISPFSTCVGMTFLVARNFRAALEITPGLAQCSERLRTVACPASADSIRPYHCLTGVFMDHYCVVIDPVFSVNAFKVPYNGSFETSPYITTSGRSQQRCFRYITGKSGEKILTMEKIGSMEAAVQFSDIDHNTALRQISMRAARESKLNSQVPSKKVLVVRTSMSERPTKIASTPLNAEFVVAACRVQVDFAQRTLTMQVPSTDWLFKPENERYLGQLQRSQMYTPVNDAVLNLVVALRSPPDDELVSDQLDLMGEVAERLGLARGEILQIARSLDFFQRT
ncbi:lysine decarboxylase [Fusarium subglutinans]|uniref:Lysine decarboxylase n=1 Tax=Gibberella subglutinans TaxID=42677 RepID=A0A8H5QC78_GIBSU|nr:lysine decarboxylase [Fusarium subglutinans]KAF5612089.1 lysine decarboxylase [Fusarium subglutinans]